MSPKKLSIAIPTWGSYGKGDEFIDDLLRTIEIQTFKNFEVCISDHCKDDMVLEVVKKFSSKFKIKYAYKCILLYRVFSFAPISCRCLTRATRE